MTFDYDPTTELFQVSCDEISSYPSISLYVDSNWITMKNSDYILDYGDFCALAILPNNDGDFWMLGSPFFQEYYTVFDNSDHTAAKIGFAPSASSSKSDLTTGDFPEQSLDDVMWELTWMWDWYWVLSFEGFMPVDWLWGGVATTWIDWFGFEEEFYQ
uniref:Peptidase A1 domain-containing protein n=1 Tax=Strombidium inclinatum TaxID=197538 RepID=A0A7S3IMZ2_9SPIT|mmetsp:Transcript_29362/g.44314  ORF Transcript_29362/g.44314 Transcript_29362/m.44314 type:complete len:158 (+) Transcript_29362:282-755(+)